MSGAHLRGRRRIMGSVLALLALAAAGCSTPPHIEPAGEGPSFARTGRFALLVEYRQGERDAVQGGFALRDSAQGQRLDLANPMGSTLARIDITPQRAVLTRSDGSTDVAPHADALVEQVLGSPIPVVGLRDWMQGRLAPGAARDVVRDDQGNLVRFTQDDWRVELSRYDNLGPRLLRLRRAESGRDISLRLIVDGE